MFYFSLGWRLLLPNNNAPFSLVSELLCKHVSAKPPHLNNEVTFESFFLPGLIFVQFKQCLQCHFLFTIVPSTWISNTNIFHLKNPPTPLSCGGTNLILTKKENPQKTLALLVWRWNQDSRGWCSPTRSTAAFWNEADEGPAENTSSKFIQLFDSILF